MFFNQQNLSKFFHGPLDVSSLIPTSDKNVYLTESGLTGKVYYNGYVLFDVMPFDENTSYYWKRIRDFQEKQFHEVLKSGKFVRLYSLIDKRIGLQTFADRFREIPENLIWDSFIEIYTRSDFGFEVLENVYPEIFQFAEFSRERKKRLSRLKNSTYTLYHGESVTYPVPDYYSWTLSRRIAKFFANRYNGNGYIWRKKVPRCEFWDYLNFRNEKEILWYGENYDISRLQSGGPQLHLCNW